ncbi:MAG: sulfotransferase [Dokdonella sp.]|uniref:tetratricopeptide repeat-containing sulfotransferase family protein n=1 Tax=Dokdonella sp. TaxID=2291710 RepID=UPI0032652A6A
MAMHAPYDTDATLAVARQLWDQGDIERSEPMLRDLVAREPAREDIGLLLATLHQSQGRLGAASQTMYDLCEANAFAPALGLRAAQFIQNCSRQPLAAQLCDAVLSSGPRTAELCVVAGNIAREEGYFDKARALYTEALEAGVDLNRWFVLGALAHTMRYTDAGHPDVARMSAHFNDGSYAPRSRAATGFGLAKALDDIGDYDAAAQTLRTANALVRSVLTWSASAWDAAIESRLSESILRLPRAAQPNFIPVFIVGLPRSGTTLLATHLARQTGARDRGELRMLRFIADRLASGGHLGDPEAILEAAEWYRMHAVQDDAPAVAYIDQDPLNFRNLRYIEALWPHARIVHCRRNRRDTALSLWSQDFANAESAFAYDFADIARYSDGHDRLMRQWKNRLSVPTHTIDYERFVADPFECLRTLAAALDLPQPAVAPGDSRDAPIGSASVWQARQPIHASSVERWRNYAPFVKELTGLPSASD